MFKPFSEHCHAALTPMHISVIVTTYQRPDALQAVLASLAAQQDRQFDVLVADDGSRRETAAVVKRAASFGTIPIRHVWQEDRGFRAGAIRNRAASQAGGDYFLFLDGDCIAPPNWVARHRALAEPNWFVAGNRVLLAEDFTKHVLAAQTALHEWNRAQWRVALRSGDVNRLSPLWTVPLGPLRKLARYRWQRVRTCNLGVARHDFEAVNGFDEIFEGWGYEDSDLAVRLLNHGARRKDGAFATGVLHLWHRESDRNSAGGNWARLQERIRSKTVFATRGLDRYR